MLAYLDASVLLRVLFGSAGALPEWRSIERGVASALAEVECLRTLDRLRLAAGLDDAALAVRREAVYRLFESIEVVAVSPAVLARASQPLPTTLGTLDAIHLATAQLWREERREACVLATHDLALGTAARALGFEVLGTGPPGGPESAPRR